MSTSVVEYQRGSDRGLKLWMVDERGRPVTGFATPTDGSFVMRETESGPDAITKAFADLTIDEALGTVVVNLSASDTSGLELGTYLAEASLTVGGGQYASRTFFVKLVGSLTLTL